MRPRLRQHRSDFDSLNLHFQSTNAQGFARGGPTEGGSYRERLEHHRICDGFGANQSGKIKRIISEATTRKAGTSEIVLATIPSLPTPSRGRTISGRTRPAQAGNLVSDLAEAPIGACRRQGAGEVEWGLTRIGSGRHRPKILGTGARVAERRRDIQFDGAVGVGQPARANPT